MKSRKLTLLTAVALLAVSALAFAGPKLYKWVDKDGITHYGSSIPPEYASQQTEQIDAHGNVVKTTAAQKTPEQLAAEQKAQQQAAQQAQVDAAQQAHDKVLLDTYTSTNDMDRDRDSKLASIDAQINVFNGTISGLQTTLADLQDRSNELVSKNQPVTPKLQKQIDDTKAQLITNQQQLLKEQQHKQEVSTQFANDIARFKQLTAAPAATTH
jgi:chromosome segregation ATPase